jgi:hypothetical protein
MYCSFKSFCIKLHYVMLLCYVITIYVYIFSSHKLLHMIWNLGSWYLYLYAAFRTVIVGISLSLLRVYFMCNDGCLIYLVRSADFMYTLSDNNPAAWNFLKSLTGSDVTWRTVAITIIVVLVSPYFWIRCVSLSSNHYSQSRPVYINRRHKYICLIWS